MSLNWVSPIEIDFSIEGEADTLWVIWHVENLTGETGEIAVEFPRWEGHDGVSYNNGFRRSQVFSGLIIKEIEYVVVRGNETERYKYAYE